jgi:hypothetical protein
MLPVAVRVRPWRTAAAPADVTALPEVAGRWVNLPTRRVAADAMAEAQAGPLLAVQAVPTVLAERERTG